MKLANQSPTATIDGDLVDRASDQIVEMHCMRTFLRANALALSLLKSSLYVESVKVQR